jgi:hypothetical protein
VAIVLAHARTKANSEEPIRQILSRMAPQKYDAPELGH